MRFSVSEEEISKIDHYIEYGQPKKALEFIAEIEKKELSELDSDNLSIYKVEALMRYGFNEKASEIVEKLLQKYQRNKESKLYLDAITQKVWLLTEKCQRDEALVLVKDVNKILKTLPKEKFDEFYIIRYSILLAEGVIYYFKRNYRRHAKLAKECLKLAEKNNSEYRMGVALISLYESHRKFDHLEIAFDYLEEAMRIFEKLNNQYRIAYIEHYYGNRYFNKRDYDNAINCYLKLIPFVEQTENAYQKITILMKLSSAYNHNLDYDIAYEYDKQAYQLLEKTDRIDVKEIIIRKMIEWSFDKGDVEKANEYIREYEQVLLQLKDPHIKLILQNYENRKKLIDLNKSKSPKLREELIYLLRKWLANASEKKIPAAITDLLLCSLLLDEYIETGNNDLIDEIESRTSVLLEESKVQGEEIKRIAILSYRLMALWLRAKIQNDRKRSDEVLQLLAKTEEYAGVKGNKLLLKFLKGERERYATIIGELEEIVEKYIATE